MHRLVAVCFLARLCHRVHWIAAMWQNICISFISQHWDGRCTLSPYLNHYRQRCPDAIWTWWRHQMETFSALLVICAGNSPVAGEFPAQRPVTRSFGVFFDLCLNKPLSKQWWGWWLETLSRPLWRHCHGSHYVTMKWLHLASGSMVVNPL